MFAKNAKQFIIKITPIPQIYLSSARIATQKILKNKIFLC
jgi:hypothetical protein